MSFDLEARPVTFTCPQCTRSTVKTMGWTLLNSQFTCGLCGTVSAIDNSRGLGIKRPSTFSSKFETSGFNFIRR